MNEEQEIQLIYQIITHSAGFDVDIAGSLLIRQYEYPMWAVEWEEWKDYNDLNSRIALVREFTDPLEAASFFCKKRYELRLGLDFRL